MSKGNQPSPKKFLLTTRYSGILLFIGFIPLVTMNYLIRATKGLIEGHMMAAVCAFSKDEDFLAIFKFFLCSSKHSSGNN